MTNRLSTTQQPTIVKYVQPYRNGIQSNTLHRHAIGYVLRGKKYIYYGDVRHEINRGDVFYLSTGHHYIEDMPENNKPFEQIVFYYDTEQLNKILNNLSISYQLDITNDHKCPNCDKQPDVIYPAWNTLKNFFSTINQYIKEDMFGNDNTAETLKITELIYLLITNNECCLKSKILSNVDTLTASFEQTIHDNIFNDISIEELAQKCNRSLTSFKKEFKKHFFEPPHKWFIKQRLMHSRLLLISTNKSVSEIGIECNFPNTSHFIKLFKKEFGVTPVAYRHNNERGNTKYSTAPQAGTKFVSTQV